MAPAFCCPQSALKQTNNRLKGRFRVRIEGAFLNHLGAGSVKDITGAVLNPPDVFRFVERLEVQPFTRSAPLWQSGSKKAIPEKTTNMAPVSW